MSKSPLRRFLAILCLASFAVAAPAPAETERPLVLAHYMPWYGAKPAREAWGWHWTMNHFDPDVVRWDGEREIASHDYPLIGPYDSGDPHALECQVLQMKLAGIDGVIIDWYGIEDVHDYAAIHQNTLALIPLLKKAGLKFAICYEDQSIGQIVKQKDLTAEEGIVLGREALQWVEQSWFEDEAYVKIDDRPVLLIFGPQYFSGAQWKSLGEDFSSHPLIYALPHLAEPAGADGPFGWPPVDGGKTVSTSAWRGYLERLHARSAEGESVVAVAFPGFRDIYEKAELHESYGFIDDRNGETLAETLDLALKQQPRLLQIATWNDYGEGTVVEPSRDLGYRNLEMIQERVGDAETVSPADLRLPTRLFQLRQRAEGDSESLRQLEEAAELLFAMKPEPARALLDSASARLAELPAKFADCPEPADPDYRLHTDLPYRTDPDASDYERRRCELDLYVPADSPGFATVVWFHGGGLSKGTRSIPLPLRREGIAVIAVNYRLSPKVQSPAYLEDAAAAVAWAFENIADYGGSPDSIFVSGHSAGGYLASMIGLDQSWLAAHEIDADRIAGLIPFSGHTITHFTIRKERGIDGTRAVVDALAPLYHVRKDAPPLLLITGDRDLELLGRYEETAYFWRMMQVVGHPDTRLKELKGLNHGNMPEGSFPLLLPFVREHAR